MKKRNSSKVNLTISIIFHSLLVTGIFFFAAREGMLGKKLKEITVTMAPKEKKPEPPKPKPPEPKVEPPKPVETPKVAAVTPPPPPMAQTAPPPPPVAENAPPAVAPAPVSLPAFDFNDGAKEVVSADANSVYKALIESALRSKWSRPDDLPDQNFVAEVELAVSPEGKLTNWRWLKGSGNTRWDDSVKVALAQTKAISRPPPKGFPGKFLARFDVESQRTEEVLHLSSR